MIERDGCHRGIGRGAGGPGAPRRPGPGPGGGRAGAAPARGLGRPPGRRAGRRRPAAGRRNGGSAAQAEHLAAELLGWYRANRRPLSGPALGTEGAALTAIDNDFGPDEVFTRQVEAHGRQGDVFVALSTSGRSSNVLAAVATARAAGMTTWGLTGAAPNPLAGASDDAICVPSRSTATVQEVHQVLIHLLCGALDRALAAG